MLQSIMHPWPANNLESGPSSNSVPEDYENETWPVNNLVQPGSYPNSVPSLWTDHASQDRLLQNQHSNFMMYPGSAVPGEYYPLIENQHLNSVQFTPSVHSNCNSNSMCPGFAVASEEFDPMDNVQVNSMYLDRAVPGGVYLLANQQFSPEGALQDGQSFYNDSGQVNSMYAGGVAVKGGQFSIHDLRSDELTDCNNQNYVELGGFSHCYHNDMWPSQAGGGEGVSSSVSVLSSGSALSCQTVCSTSEPEALLSPTATDPSADRSRLLPAEHPCTSPEVATSENEVTEKRKPRKSKCEVRVSKKLPKSNDMLRQRLWLTFDEDEQAKRATRVAKYLLSGSKTKYMDTPFDPEFEGEIRALRHAVQENVVTTVMFNKVKDLVERYGKHGST